MRLDKKYNAIIAINPEGKGFLVNWISPENWMLEAYKDFDCLEELRFDLDPGLYYASMIGYYCCGDICKCEAHDCFETDWILTKKIIDFTNVKR